jgi:hypothetical protein
MCVNLASDTRMRWTFTLGCFVTLAARHAWQSLHQAAMSLDTPCQTTFLQSSPLLACRHGQGGLFAPAWPCLGPLVVVGIAEARLQLPFLGILHCSLERELFPPPQLLQQRAAGWSSGSHLLQGRVDILCQDHPHVSGEPWQGKHSEQPTLIKKENQIFLLCKEIQNEQLQSHI